ncbi:LysR substrate-binding domain-containing protein [Amycolatopsis sp. 3B14]|uniref:LysR substrate-binding domain-containing protein n=1 Tax=Amycolatopsis sp. 3B14 TaxID=3243600 RepID=UPI003D98EF80
MDFRQLSNFVVLAEELHFRRAAERLLLTQPALSRQIAALEHELDAVLFNRGGREVRLTAQGHLFLIEARRMLQQFERAKRIVKQEASQPRGTIRVGFIESFGSRGLSLLLKTSRRRFPGLAHDLLDANSQTQMDALRRGALDVAFLRGPVVIPGVECRTLWEEDFLLACPGDSPLPPGTNGQPPSPAALAPLLEAHPFVQFSPKIEPVLYTQTSARALEANLPLDPATLVNKTSALISLVSSGFAVSLVPAALTAGEHDGVRFLAAPGATRSAVCVAWRADEADDGVASFVATILEERNELAPEYAFGEVQPVEPD